METSVQLKNTKLVAVDLDNTLLTPAKQVSTRTAAAVARLRNAGVAVIPVTARGLWNVRTLLPYAPFGPYVISGNGAIIISFPGEEVVELTPLTLSLAHRIVNRIRQSVPGISFAAETMESLVGEPWIMEVSLSSRKTDNLTDITKVLSSPLMKLLCSAPGWAPDQLITTAADILKKDAVVTHSEGDWIEICDPRVDKASALARTCQRLNIKRDEVIGIGDQLNDISMLRWTGTAAAVSNAIPAVLKIADIVLPSNANEGVASLMDYVANKIESRH